MMIKALFNIDEIEIYPAVFFNVNELVEFIEDNLADGSVARLLYADHEYSLNALIADPDFEPDYKVELVGKVLLGDSIKGMKVWEIETILLHRFFIEI